MTGRPRGIDSHPFPAERRAVTAALRAGRRRAPIHGLLEIDVTEARAALAGMDPPGSFTAFVVAAVARAAAAHPHVHAYRDWRRRLVVHRHVDVATLIEVSAPGGGTFPLAHVLRDADVRSVGDLGSELRAVKADPGASPSGRLLRGWGRRLRWVPGASRLGYAAMERSRRVRMMTGTVAVTAVGMFADGGGHGIGFPTVASLSVLIGGIDRRPRVIGDRIEARTVVDLTVTVDHVVVDGAPAARFGAELRRLLESDGLVG